MLFPAIPNFPDQLFCIFLYKLDTLMNESFRLIKVFIDTSFATDFQHKRVKIWCQLNEKEFYFVFFCPLPFRNPFNLYRKKIVEDCYLFSHYYSKWKKKLGLIMTLIITCIIQLYIL